MTNLVFTPAYQLAQMIRDRTVSSVEILDAIIKQIANHNQKLNAICTFDEEGVRQQALLADETNSRGESHGILHGVPITIKDTLETAGLITTGGYKPLKNYVPQQDAVAVSRLRDAGAIIIGKTNPAKLAGDYQSANDLFPHANNPWNLNYTPGGSSGGSGAAVAAGLSPLDLASDIGGSIRHPSHFCGVFGLKPTDRRVCTIGHIPEVPGMPKCIRQMLVVGPIARCLEDLKLCFTLIAGSDPRQPEIPPVAIDTPNSKPWKSLRIAWTDEINLYQVAQSIKSTIQSIAQKLTDSGTYVEKWVPNYDFPSAWHTYFVISAYLSLNQEPFNFDYIRDSLSLMWGAATQGDKELRELSGISKAAVPVLLTRSFKGYFTALTQRDRFIAQMDQQLEQWDAWICPVAMTPAFTHRPKGEAVEIDGRQVPYLIASGAYLVPFNFTGHPVVVIPVGHTKDGLPIGIQIVGKRWREMELLAVASEIYQVVGEFQHPPGF